MRAAGFDARSVGDGEARDGSSDAAPDAPGVPRTQTVSPTISDADDEFGYALAVSRDGTTIAIVALAITPAGGTIRVA